MLAGACALLPAARAQIPRPGAAYVRLLLPFPPGATSDVLARVVVERAATLLDEAIVIDHRPGAGGTIGTAEAARAAADGRTLLWGTVSNMAIAPALFPNPGYDPLAFVPIALLFGMPHVVTIHASHGVSTLQALVELARSRPGALSYASSGNGTISHLIGELFQRRTGTELLHVPYRSGPQGLPDHLSGRIDLRFDTLLDARPAVLGGKVRALAVTAAARSALLPDVPTMAEAGVADFVVTGWFAVYGPPGLPADEAQRLAGMLLRVLRDDGVLEAVRPLGVEILAGGRHALAAHTHREVARWGDVIRSAGIKPG